MNKKFFLSMLTTVMVVLASVSFISCGSDDDDDVTPPQGTEGTTPPKGGEEVESPEDNLPDAAKSFVGYWRSTTSDIGFVFFADGTCESYSNESRDDSGYWTYNEETNILATTLDAWMWNRGAWQWNVTLSNSEAWAGILYGSEKSQSFSRYDYGFVSACLYNTEWECDTLNLRFFSGLEFVSDDYPNNGIYNFKLDYRQYENHIIEITPTTIVMECSITYNGYVRWSKVTVTINNYRKPNATLTFSSYPDHVYKIKTE